MRTSIFMASAVAAASAADIALVTFDGAASSTHKFTELNDPVMGGKSTGTWNVNATGHFGVFDGEVVNVPSLKAPGFIKAAADGTFVDVSAALGGDLVLNVRTKTPEYSGFRVSFAADTVSAAYSCAGGGSLPFSRGCFKALFDVPAGDSFAPVRIPFTAFSDMWSPATGNHTKDCSSDKDVCPTAKALSKIVRIEVWAEGADGKAHLEIDSITASPPKTPVATAPLQARPPAKYDTCGKPVQDKLKYGISGRTTPAGLPLPVDSDESLAEAVCCDLRTATIAEPRFLYQAPDIALFSKMDQNGITTFYDSVCGIPLFKTPVNRTMADFQADTNEHGWPSFRAGEVFTDNVKIEGGDENGGAVTSACGTHLGSYLPDAKGSRWCIDLSCISGNKK